MFCDDIILLQLRHYVAYQRIQDALEVFSRFFNIK